MLKESYDILVLTETHDKGALKRSKNFIPGEPAPPEDPYAGVSFLLSDRVAKCVSHSGSCGSRITFIKINSSPCNFFIIGVYMPHQQRKTKPFSSDTLKDLKSVISKVKSHDCIIVLGDLNSKLGRNIGKLTGNWCVHKQPNKAGKDILDLMHQSNLTAVSTFFQPPRGKNNATYLAKDPQYKPSQIDYVLMSKRWASSVKDCKVRWGHSINRWGRHYDHATVMCTIQSKTRSNKNNKFKPHDFSALKTSQEVRVAYEHYVSQNLNKEHFDKESPSSCIKNLKNVLTSAVNATVPLRKPTPWRKREVSTTTQTLIIERQRNYHKMTPAEQKESAKAISHSSREDFRTHIDGIINDIAAAEAVGNTREVNRLVKTLGGKTAQPTPMPSKDLQGDPIVSSEQLLKEWNTFLSSKFTAPNIDREDIREATVSDEDYITDQELLVCLKGLSDGKAPGADGLPIEAYKYSETARRELFRTVKLIWNTEEVPEDIVKGVFIMLYKKKDRDDFKNYRAICLLCHAYKLLSAIIAKRLSKTLEPYLPDSQAGFRPARGTRDNVCILKWAIEMLIRESKCAVVTFIDYTAAFDTVSHSFLDRALSSANTSVKLRRVIQTIFRAASGCVRISKPNGEIALSETFNIARGVLQGDIFSPVAFIAGLMQIFNSHDTEGAGITLGDPSHQVTICSLEYADDAGLIDCDVESASTRISEIAVGSRNDASMEISIPKTKAMHIHKRVKVTETTEEEIAAMGFKHICPECQRDFPTKKGLAIHIGRWCDGGKTMRSRKGSLADKNVQHKKRKEHENELPHVSLEGHQLDNVYSFEYLGSRIQCDGDEEADVEHRMIMAQNTFNSLSHLWADHRLPKTMKLRLYTSSVCSSFTHACEAWKLSENIRAKINGFNSRCLSRITGKDFAHTATQPDYDLVAAIIRRRLRFVGHILRMDPDRLLYRTFVAYINSSHPRPDGSLLHGCDDMTLEQVKTKAQNRRLWSGFVNSVNV